MTTGSKPAASYYLALFLLVISLVNLNGLLAMLAEKGVIPQVKGLVTVFFVFALPITLYLIVTHARISNIGDILKLYFLFFGLYLFGSLVPLIADGNIEGDQLRAARGYLSVVIFTSAIYFWAATLSDAELAQVFRILKGVLLIASLGTIFSQELSADQSEKLQRFGGFYVNENTAAVSALYCLVLVLAFPARSRLLTLTQGGIALTALALTFSRTGLLLFLLLSLLYFFHRPSLKALVLFLIGMVLLSLTLWLVFENDLFGLTWYQRERLADVVDILTGRADEETAGARAILFDAGLRITREVFPWGAGLNELHRMDNVMRNTPNILTSNESIWNGVHNTYLMVLGEAGLAALVAFLAFWARLIWKLSNSAFRIFAMGATVIMLVTMVVGHAVLAHKMTAAVLALVMAIAARSERSWKASFAPETAPRGSRP